MSLWLPLNIYTDWGMAIDAVNFDSLQPVVDYIKKWESGRIRIRKFRLDGRRTRKSFRFTHCDFVTALQCFRVLSVKLNEPRTEEHYVDLVLKRDVDNIVLCVAYSSKSSHLFLGDIPCEGPLPDVSRVLCTYS